MWEITQNYVDIRTELPTLGIAVYVPVFGLGQVPRNETVTIEPHEDINATGNFGSAAPALWLFLTLLAGTGLAVSAVRRRKRQNG